VGTEFKSDAGTVAAFGLWNDSLGCVTPRQITPAKHAAQGSGLVLGVFHAKGMERHNRPSADCCSVRGIDAKRDTKKGTKIVPFLGPQWFHRNQRNSFGNEWRGRRDSETRGLVRDSFSRLISSQRGAASRSKESQAHGLLWVELWVKLKTPNRCRPGAQESLFGSGQAGPHIARIVTPLPAAPCTLSRCSAQVPPFFETIAQLAKTIAHSSESGVRCSERIEAAAACGVSRRGSRPWLAPPPSPHGTRNPRTPLSSADPAPVSASDLKPP